MSAFEVFIDHELKLVRITVKGEILQADGEKIITHARTTAAEQNYNVLYDIRQATATVPFSSWYYMPRDLPVFKKTKFIKAALLASPQDKAFKGYKFYENVINNMGIKFRIFFDEAEALLWLRINAD